MKCKYRAPPSASYRLIPFYYLSTNTPSRLILLLVLKVGRVAIITRGLTLGFSIWYKADTNETLGRYAGKKVV